MSKKLENNNEAAGSFAVNDIKKPVALAAKLQVGNDPFCQFLLGKFSPLGREALAKLVAQGADTKQLAELLAGELSAIAAAGQPLYAPATVNGTKLRKSTRKLIHKNPTGSDLVRLNTLVVQDVFPEHLAHDSCEPVETIVKKGVTFRIYKQTRILKTKTNVSFKITFPAINGQTSTHAPSLEEAYIEIETLVDRVLAGQTPVSKKESKNRDIKAKSYTDIAAEVAKVGKTDERGVVEFVKDAVKAQLKLGLDRPLLEFVVWAYEVVAKPVVRCLLQSAVAQFATFRLARTDVDPRANRKFIADIRRFATAMPKQVHERDVAGLPKGCQTPPCPPDVHVDEPLANEIQRWLYGLKVDWRRRRDVLSEVRAFMAYCRDALHALPPGILTAAHIVPRPKPSSNLEPVPAPVLSFQDVWRILINLQDLESVWFFSLAVFAGLHQSEIARLVWEHDIVWVGTRPVQVFVAAGKGKDKHGNRMGQHVDIRHPVLSENSCFSVESPRNRLFAGRIMECHNRKSGQMATKPRSCLDEPSSVFSPLPGGVDQSQSAECHRIPPGGG